MEQIKFLVEYIRSMHKSDEGATAVEYSLLAALIAGIVVVAVGPLGTKIAKMFTDLTAAI